jgi:hypothetical protein
MAVITYSTDSATVALNGRVITGFAVGDIIEVTPVNDQTSRVNSADGVSITKRADAGVTDLVVRVQEKSDDDFWFGNLNAGNAPIVIEGSLRENFNKDGIAGVDTWQFEGGSIVGRAPKIVNNNEDAQKVMEYRIQFRNSTRI